MSTGSRLKSLRYKLNKTQKEFSKMFEIKIGALSHYEQDRRELPNSLARKIYLSTNCSLNWLLAGEGEMFLDNQSNNTNPTNKINKPEHSDPKLAELQGIINKIEGKSNNDLSHYKVYEQILDPDGMVSIPIHGEIAAGLPLEKYDIEYLDYATIPKTLLKDAPEEYMVFLVNGNSMEPKINHRDLVVIRLNRAWAFLEGKIVAVRIDNGITLKRLEFDHNLNLVILKSFNSDYKDIIFSKSSHNDVKLFGYLETQIRAW